MAESTTSRQSPEFDPRSPYYVDPYFPDYEPDENLPRVKLNKAEDNYFIWKNQFLQFLIIKNKAAFVDGTMAIPEPSSPLYEAWKVCDARVKWWMLSSLSEKLKHYVGLADPAHKAWVDLRKIFVPSVDFKIYELRQRIATLRQDGDSVLIYFGKMRSAWMELREYDPLPECKCGEVKERAEEAREKEERHAFLMGLNKELSFMRTQIMIMNPPPSLNQAYLMLSRAESTFTTRKQRYSDGRSDGK